MFNYNFVRLLSSFEQPWLSPEDLVRFANAISRTGAPLDNCWGFIDGIVREVCKPEKKQRVLYNGHHRVHALKFQSVTCPNGLIANLYGPVEGRRHDAAILADSNLLQTEEYSYAPDGSPAYPSRIHLQTGFKNAVHSPREQIFHSRMSHVRVSVQRSFDNVFTNFVFLDFKKNMEVNLSTCGKMYLVGVLLQNAHICIHRNIGFKFYDVRPPSIEEYTHVVTLLNIIIRTYGHMDVTFSLLKRLLSI